jgi:hypothetical protein
MHPGGFIVARINIEDKIYQDNRFTKLLIKLGSKRMALGALVEAWSLAQRFYLCQDNDRLIPKKEWDEQEIAPEIIEVGFAEIREKGVYMHGAEAQFKWLLSCQAKGIRSAEAKAIKSTSVQPVLTAVQPLPTSYSFSSSFSKKNKEEEYIYINDNCSHLGNRAENGAGTIIPRKDLFADATQLMDAVPIITRDKWRHKYGDEDWIITQCSKAFDFHMTDPGAIPPTRGVWMKKLHTWLENSWEKKKKEKSTSLITAEESALFRGEE